MIMEFSLILTMTMIENRLFKNYERESDSWKPKLQRLVNRRLYSQLQPARRCANHHPSEDRDNRTIYVFLDTMNNYLEIDMIESSERFKIHDLVSFLEDIASREYHNRVKYQGSFVIYDAVKA